MDRRKNEIEWICAKVERPAVRSALFWWMLENHDRLAEAAAGQRLQWRELCAEFEAIGLTDVNGRRASEATAKKTWWRVRREKLRRGELARSAERAASLRSTYPSRLPKGLKPRVVGPVARAAPLARSVRTAEGPKPWEDPSLSPEQAAHMRAQLEKLERQQEWNDRNVTPLTKERLEELALEFDRNRHAKR